MGGDISKSNRRPWCVAFGKETNNSEEEQNDPVTMTNKRGKKSGKKGRPKKNGQNENALLYTNQQKLIILAEIKKRPQVLLMNRVVTKEGKNRIWRRIFLELYRQDIPLRSWRHLRDSSWKAMRFEAIRHLHAQKDRPIGPVDKEVLELLRKYQVGL